MPAIEFSAVTRKYGSRTALDRVSFTLPEGASLGLLGPNGAGKTTALRTGLGLVRPTSGSARLQGLDPRDARARQGVGYLPERLALPAHMKVGRFLELHGRLAGLRGAGLAAEVDEVSESTGIAARHGDRLGDLSKGLAQRVGFAQALLGKLRVLLLDEPNSGLDPIGMREARGWIAAARAWGCAVLISSHQLSEIGRLCDRIAILHDARVVAEGPIDTIVREGEELEDAFVRLVAGPAAREVGRGD